jgi:hypothetical protein
MKSNLQKVNSAHSRREYFLEIHGKVRLLEIKILYEMWRKKDYDKLGFEDWKSYVSSPVSSGGLGISREWATQLIQAYQKYVVELKLPETIFLEVSPRKLYFLKDQANPQNVKELISVAQATTLKDLEKERKGIKEAECPHEEVEEWLHCKQCGSWIKSSLK